MRRHHVLWIAIAALSFGPVGVAFTQGVTPRTLDPVSGGTLFRTKGCVACHAINGAGGAGGPDLGRIERPQSYYALAASMWNHLPPMSQRIWASGVDRPYFTADEMSDLFAFLATSGGPRAPGAVDLGGRPPRETGDPQRGRQLLADKACLTCHALTSDAARGTVGGSLDRPTGFGSPWIVVSTMWNHTYLMELETRRQQRTWPRLTSDEMADLAAFLARP